ncbi:MAG: extracellular solute-binding protein [Lachnospiraceae bacterium]|nr:extracellular solute-binding protein [Lachnospiraceae bacterium]MDD7327904.1 extracellular solute-binding protein [Lachnospiraceae bacterium]MDY2759727.1 extracellular solute-binding protein [Lachnospiraceae bacterium]
MKRLIALFIAATLALAGCGATDETAPVSDDVITLRIANSEEYIDEGGWDADETIELADGQKIRGVDSLVSDYEKWYQEKYGKRVRVLYSTYGTNEDLYNQMTLGNSFDLVCPSEYMIMKLMREKKLEPLSDDFYDKSQIYNYYAKGVSPYIYGRMRSLTEGTETLTDYAAGYMWGTLGTVYNPAVVSDEDASSYGIYLNRKYRKRITIKDSVRDTYFAGLAIEKEKELAAADPDYATILNDTSQTTVDKVQDIITDMRENAYSMETDTAKQDLVTRKADASLQWSGDGVFSMDQAEEDGLDLCYAVPEEGSNLWFDGWVMLKNGINGDKDKKQAAEAFINYISKPDSVVRNMYYIGYTSAITGGDDDTVFEYLEYTYGSDDDDAVDYDVSYLFDDRPGSHVLRTDRAQLKRQLYAQYPTEDVLARCAVMKCFSDEANRRISQMWTNVRCYRFPWER